MSAVRRDRKREASAAPQDLTPDSALTGGEGPLRRSAGGTLGEFALYDLQVVVERIEGHCTCEMRVGDRIMLRSGKLSMPDRADFCLYALQAAIPLLPAKQRKNHAADWMETDARVTCPDPACRLIMRIDRVGRRVLRHGAVSAVPLQPRARGRKR
jgi:uncharacterized repeat protein (TIGR04076 family)